MESCNTNAKSGSFIFVLVLNEATLIRRRGEKAEILRNSGTRKRLNSGSITSDKDNRSICRFMHRASYCNVYISSALKTCRREAQS